MHTSVSVITLFLGLLLVSTGARVAPGSRGLRGDATTTAVSDGGLASSKSASTGDSSVTTTTVATQGGTAVAEQTASNGTHSKTVIAVGDKVLATEQHDPAQPADKKAPTWEGAPPCPFSPTAANSVKDLSGRLWGWDKGASCAFKVSVTWESAPPCPATVSLKDSVVDLSGRLWGWWEGASCAFKPAPSAANRKLLQQAAGKEAGTNKDEQLVTVSKQPLSKDLPAIDSQPYVTKTSTQVDGQQEECVTYSESGQDEKTTTKKCGKGTLTDGKVAITGFANAPTNAPSSPAASNINAVPASTSDVAIPTSTIPTVPGTSTVLALPASVTNNAAPNAIPTAANTTALVDAEPMAAEDTGAPAAEAAAPPAAEGTATPAAEVPAVPKANTVTATPAPPQTVKDTDVLLTSTNRFGVTWAAAPVCVGLPSKKTAVQDTLGRLWWYESGISCAYRNAEGGSLTYAGYVQVKWETSEACHGEATLINSMADAEGRLWGWDEATGNNCKFVDAQGKAVKHDNMLQAVIAMAAAESTELKP